MRKAPTVTSVDLTVDQVGTCSRCGRDVRCGLDPEDIVCTGCLTLQEDVADTAAFVAACYRAARAAASPDIARRAHLWAELALENLVRRQSVGYDDRPLTVSLSPNS